jgi:[ribosomal protein S5]-alanine N-acetyltransferase
MTILDFSTFPILSSSNLTLRQLTIDDQESIFTLRTDPAINKYLGRTPSKSMEDAIAFIHKINENVKNNNSLYWAITMTETETFVGTICLYNFSTENNSCEIGYELLTPYQGQGIMREAIQTVVGYVFNNLEITQINAFTHIENQNSSNLLTKCNFSKTNEFEPEDPNLILYTLSIQSFNNN